jgi:hypothetical protein
VRQLRLYAPVIVLLAYALLVALGVTLDDVAIVVLAAAVFIHIRAEQVHFERRR